MKLIERILDKYYCEKIFEAIKNVPYFVDMKRIYTKDCMIILFKKQKEKTKYYREIATISKNNAFKTFVYCLDDLYKNIIDVIRRSKE